MNGRKKVNPGVNRQNSEGVCQGGNPGTGKLYTVAPPTPVGAWSMALELRQRIE